MAIRIIDPNPDPKMAKYISCKECGSKLEYFKIDIMTMEVCDYSGDCGISEYIICPSCNRKVIIR